MSGQAPSKRFPVELTEDQCCLRYCSGNRLLRTIRAWCIGRSRLLNAICSTQLRRCSTHACFAMLFVVSDFHALKTVTIRRKIWQIRGQVQHVV